MHELVFIESANINDEPFTTDEIIAEYSGNSRDSVTKLIRTHKKALEVFGTLGFEIRASGRARKKIYHLIQEQATLLITFLDNTPTVVAFKTELVHQFYAMKAEQIERQIARGKVKDTSKTLREAIKEAGYTGKWDYSNFYNLIYKTSIGFIARQLRKARGAMPKAVAADFMTAEELKAVDEREKEVITLLGLGLTRDEMKAIFERKGVMYQTTLKMPETAR